MSRLKIWNAGTSTWDYVTGIGGRVGDVMGSASGTSGHLAIFDGDGYHLEDGGVPASTTRLIPWVIKNPAIGGIPGPRLKVAYTVTRIDAFVVGGTSADFNIEERSTIGTPGTDIMYSEMSIGVSGDETTAFANAGLAANNGLWLDISNVVGAVEYLAVTLAVTG
jgi:hypothetical protein